MDKKSRKVEKLEFDRAILGLIEASSRTSTIGFNAMKNSKKETDGDRRKALVMMNRLIKAHKKLEDRLLVIALC
ncbi:MAG: hypothetical protein A2648_01970 [Candidatus Lloydbacteria bacterium RIFCSPHIGHO2_01_FULL_41_20]|uniref:Uncharacterized protein n=1 Tax=Candidatus Lloydbacteria bacterium RIFCSPHIGHO2_01_FULL_41_20 TaxID=1798657 RepID=A0A1G2CSH1_9BACT|nr:MAG: hypothetical protein A2648_01970 [Candidatus Lloydbacteria bacterium RIFCSPHIGHO2_01_FULL_41_20]